jgi:hypothetical protein
VLWAGLYDLAAVRQVHAVRAALGSLTNTRSSAAQEKALGLTNQIG